MTNNISSLQEQNIYSANIYDILGDSSRLLKILEAEASDEEDLPPQTIIDNDIHNEPDNINNNFSTETELNSNSTVAEKEDASETRATSEDYHNSPSKNSLTDNSLSIKRKMFDTLSPKTISTPTTSILSPLRPIGLSTPTDLMYSSPSGSFEGVIPLSKKKRYDNGPDQNVTSPRTINRDILKKESPYVNRTPQKTKYDMPDQYPTTPQKQPENPFHSPLPIKRPLEKLNNFLTPSIPSTRHRRNDSSSNNPVFLNYHRESQIAPSVHPPRPLEKISINSHQYTILKEIGRGSSGKVYQVLSDVHRAFFALKWIRVKNEDDRQTNMNEIELLHSLSNENHIVGLLDYYTSSSVIYIVMEFGEIDLAHLIQRQSKKKWDLNFIRYYWKQMLECVYAIHHHNIVHSDLKPANFVLVQGWIKLIDFGIAKKVSDDTTNIHRGIQVGTVNYMSPESLLDLNEGTDKSGSLMKLGRPSDVWSLGCILYQMVYGKTPFYHLQLQQKLICIPNPDYAIAFPEYVTTESDEQPIKVPPMLLRILKNCLNRNPALRPPLTELLTHPFVNIV